MTRQSYPNDLTQEEWQLLEPEMPALTTAGRPRSVPWREIVNGTCTGGARGMPSAVCRLICPPGPRSTLRRGP